MWRAILVDDEEFVRAELMALFPWENYQFELIGEAENGQIAMDLIATTNPDLVITDIRMSPTDGLELTSWLAEHYPEIVVAIVSAYNDFPLVRAALRLGAVDYLIKAEATVETAGAFLKRVGGILAHRRIAQCEQEELANKIACYHSLALESFWRNVFTQASDEVETELLAQQLKIKLDHIWFGLVFIHVSQYYQLGKDNQQELFLTLQENIRENWDYNWVWNMINFRRGDFVVIVNSLDDKVNARMVEKLKEIACHLALDTSVKKTTSSSSRLCLFADLPESFREVQEVNLLRLYHQEGRYIDSKEFFKLHTVTPPKISELLATWERMLREVKQEDIDGFLNKVFQDIPQYLNPEEARRLLFDLIYTIRRVSFENQIRWEEIGKTEMDLPEILEQAESLYDWRNLMDKLVIRFIQLAKDNLYPQASLPFRKALFFIQSNFTLDLSLDEVANHAGVSKSYLCRIFPEYTGEHFSDYLQRLRIEHAKELLRFTNDHIYEIALKVGFWNSRYFSKVFHDAVGMTPADYRRIPLSETTEKFSTAREQLK